MSLYRAAPAVVVASMVLLLACGKDPSPTEAPEQHTGPTIEVGDPEVQAKIAGADNTSPTVTLPPLDRAAVRLSQLVDETTEICLDGERCVIHGNTYTGQLRVTCSEGSGNCGSGTYTWELVNPPAGAEWSFEPTSTELEQWTTLSVETSSETHVGLTNSQTHPVGSSGAPPVSNPYLDYPIHVMCNKNLETCPELEIVDLEQGSEEVVSDPAPTQTTLIGKKMNLKLRHKEGTGTEDYSLADKGWLVSGVESGLIVKAFDISTPNSLRLFVPSGEPDDDGEEIVYYYYSPNTGYSIIAGAVFSYEYHGNTSYNVVYANAMYDVGGPEVTSLGKTYDRVRVGPYDGLGLPWLSFGRNLGAGTYGIVFNYSATKHEEDDGGWVLALQMFQRRTEFNGPGVETLVKNFPKIYRDDCEAYGSRPGVNSGEAAKHASGTTYHWSGVDSPGNFLNVEEAYPYTDIQDVFEARMEFMFRPSGSESIWVPMGGVDWAWMGRAQRSQPYNGPSGGWMLTDSASLVLTNPLRLFPVYDSIKTYQDLGTGGCPSLPSN